MDCDALQPCYDQVTQICLDFFDQDPHNRLPDLVERLLQIPQLPMHCPVHHYIVPAALLSVCRRAQKQERALLARNLEEARSRAQHVLGGFCGFYGACGAAVGLGVFWSVITDSTPLTRQTWGELNRATGQGLLEIAQVGGPRCCKRVTYTCLHSVIPQIRRLLELDIDFPAHVSCAYHTHNQECIKQDCPYYPLLVAHALPSSHQLLAHS